MTPDCSWRMVFQPQRCDDGGMRIVSPPPLHQLRRFVVALAAVIWACWPTSALVASETGGDTAGGTTETSVYTYNLPGNVSDCVSLYPKPNCGTKPQLSGDRGGLMQYTTFGVIIAGLGFILTVIARSVRRTDQAKREQAAQESPKPSSPNNGN